MISACRVEIIGGAAVSCAYYLPAPPSWDYAAGCVAACNELGLGEVTACVAGKAPLCLSARDAGTSVDAELSACFDGGLPDPTCEMNCLTAQRACNDVCYPRPCDLCYRAGGTNCPSCPDAGFVNCMQCSEACGRQYGHCIAGC